MTSKPHYRRMLICRFIHTAFSCLYFSTDSWNEHAQNAKRIIKSKSCNSFNRHQRRGRRQNWLYSIRFESRGILPADPRQLEWNSVQLAALTSDTKTIRKAAPRVHHKNIFSSKLRTNNGIATSARLKSVRQTVSNCFVEVNRIYISMHTTHWKRKFINHLTPCQRATH